MAITTSHVASWGVREANTGTAILNILASDCVVLNVTKTNEPVMAPEHNEKGSVIGQSVYDMHTSVRMTCNVRAAVAVALNGYAKDLSKVTAVVTLDNVTYYATSLEVAESNSDYMKFNVSMERYLNDITPWNGTSESTTP